MFGNYIGANNPRFFGGFSAQALAWRTSIGLNSGTISDAILTIFDTNLFKPLVNSGDFALLSRLNIFAGLNGYQIAANTNLISSSFLVTAVSTPTFDNNGYKATTTGKYLNLNYNPATDANVGQNNIAFGWMVASPPFNGRKDSMGSENGSGGLALGELSVAFGGFVHSAFANFLTGQSAYSGRTMLAANRTNSSNVVIQVNTNQTTVTKASTAPVNLTMYELVFNESGSPTTFFDTNYHSASWCGQGALNTQFLRTCLLNTFTALGV